VIGRLMIDSLGIVAVLVYQSWIVGHG